jgi:hypothetical protein
LPSTSGSILDFAVATPTAGSASLAFVPLDVAALAAAPRVVVVGKASEVAAAVGGLGLGVSADLVAALAGGDSAKAGDAGKVVSTWFQGAGAAGAPLQHLAFVLLPEVASRHNHPARPDALPSLLKTAVGAAGSSGAPSFCFRSWRMYASLGVDFWAILITDTKGPLE